MTNWRVAPKISPNSNCRQDLGQESYKQTCIKLIDGSGKGQCRPKTGQKVVFLEG